MRKALRLLLPLLLAGVLAACGTPAAEIVMIPDAAGVDDGSFNQGAWDGVRLYAGVNNKTHNYYQPTAQSDKAYLAAIRKGVQGGAKIILLPGHAFQFAVSEAQRDYPEVSFVLLDSLPAGGPAQNTVSVQFSEEQAGYLAGYAAVMEGYRSLGFLGGAPVPGVTGYGFGFVQGAAAAAGETGETVEMRYAYNGQFVENEEARALAAKWYAEGTELIFACGGAMNRSVFAAAEEAGGLVIGSDIDQSGESSAVLTSAIKGLGTAANQMLERFYQGDFPGGKDLTLGAEQGAVGLEMENSRFSVFTQADYDRLIQKMQDGEIRITRNDEVISPLEALPPQPGLRLDYQE